MRQLKYGVEPYAYFKTACFVKYFGSMLTDFHETSITGILLMRQLKCRSKNTMLTSKLHILLNILASWFSWDFYNRDSFDETIKNLLYAEDLLHHPLLPAFNLHTHTYTHVYIHTYMYVNVSDKYLFVPNAVLTFGQMYPCPPGQRNFVAKCDTTLGQFDIWSDPGVRIRLTFCLVASQPASQLQLASQPASWQNVNLSDFGLFR